MPYLAWATVRDLTNFLMAAGMISNPPSSAHRMLDYDGALQAAIEEWERVTGWHPFLAGTTPETRYADMDGTGRVILENGIASLSSLTVNGSAFVENQQFRLLPLNAPSTGQAYTSIEWQGRPYFRFPFNSDTGAGLVAITAIWGRVTQIPADAWRAVLKLAAAEVVPQIGAGVSGGMTGWKDADASESYGDGPFSSQMTAWRADAEKTAQRYRRVRIA